VLNIWEVDGTVVRPFRNLSECVQIVPGEYFLDALRRLPKDNVWRIAEDVQLEVKECPLHFGEYYPRMYRPVFEHEQDTVTLTSEDESSLTYGLGQLATLVEQLTRLFRVISPENHNLNAYGHEIRNLIILTCTEVEAQWKGVLRANRYHGSQDRFSTNDYVKLLEPLKLREYHVNLPMYPQIPPCSPFITWEGNAASQSLPWYEAYNAVKHDRENKLSEARLEYAVNAVVACAVMLKAQYGVIPAWRDYLGQFFRFTNEPTWSDQEKYLCPVETEWKPVNFQFCQHRVDRVSYT
jgi:hypothetical protein